MSSKIYDDYCPGCLPVLLDPDTMERLPDDSPEMITLHNVWSNTTLEERQAFHKVTCQNSRDPMVLHTFNLVTKRIEAALQSNEPR